MSIIEVKNVSKKFKIYHEKSYSFKKDILYSLRKRRKNYEEFSALNNISFKVEDGEILGIIGRNGSGKSTLLELLAHILRSTKGEILVSGTISTLLELGAGFQFDFTGRENIYLNGSILGLKNREIDDRLKEIVAFAELEEFIDTPLRSYSSGMCLRLAFAIAVNVHPDILLIDEVLSVGDESFQKKSLNKILEFRRKGKTMLLVSHDLHTVERICNRVLLLEKGELLFDGEPRSAIEEYHLLVRGYDYKRKAKLAQEREDLKQKGTREVEITNLLFFDENMHKKGEFKTGEAIILRMEFKTRQEIKDIAFGVAIYDDRGNEYFGTNTTKENYEPGPIKGEGFIDFKIKGLLLPPGEFQITVAAHSKDESIVYHWLERYHSLKIIKLERGKNKEEVSCEFPRDKC